MVDNILDSLRTSCSPLPAGLLALTKLARERQREKMCGEDEHTFVFSIIALDSKRRKVSLCDVCVRVYA